MRRSVEGPYLWRQVDEEVQIVGPLPYNLVATPFGRGLVFTVMRYHSLIIFLSNV